MAYTKLGRIRPVYSGEWNSGRAYTALEMVRTSDGGLSYIAQKDVPAGTPLTNGEYWAVVLDVREVLEAAENAADRVDAVMDVKANALSATAAGNPVQIHPDKDSLIKPILSLKPIQEGSGDPSPENIRPITGRTGAELVRCGKNLLGNIVENRDAAAFHSNGDGVFVCKMLSNYILPNPVLFKAGQTYTISLTRVSGTGNNPCIIVRNPSGDTTNQKHNYGDSDHPLTFSFETDVEWNIMIQSASVNGDVTVGDSWAIQLESGSTATPFEPYQCDTFTFTFGQTVYGCKVDVNKGEMVVDWRFVSLTGTENWSMDSGDGWAGEKGNSFYIPIYGIDGFHNGEIMCNAYVTAYRGDLAAAPENSVMISAHGGEISFVKTQYSTLDAWKAYLAARHAAGTPVQIAYKLANPITIQLTPQQITALAGVNTVYGDADEITVNYNKDLTVAYKELMDRFAAIEAAMVNDI